MDFAEWDYTTFKRLEYHTKSTFNGLRFSTASQLVTMQLSPVVTNNDALYCGLIELTCYNLPLKF